MKAFTKATLILCIIACSGLLIINGFGKCTGDTLSKTIVVTATTTPSGAGKSNGTITASATGSSGFTYSINGSAFQSSRVFTNLAVGSYTIVAKDVDGFTGSQMFIISQPSFQGDWESGMVTGTGNTNWSYLEAVAPDRFTLINDGVRPGTYARVEVRNGDNPLSFCCYDTDRAEVSGMQNADNSEIFENLSSGTQRYTFSVKFDESWQAIHDNGAWGIFLQLHGPNDISPAFAFNATDQIRFNMTVGDITMPKWLAGNLSNGTLNIGHWIDFILTVKYAKDNTGFVNIMRKDEGDTYFKEVFNLTNTPTLQYDPNVNNGAVGDHYWKHGLYRNRQNFTSILYLDGLTRFH